MKWPPNFEKKMKENEFRYCTEGGRRKKIENNNNSKKKNCTRAIFR